MALMTDATPRIHLSAAQVLQDNHRMKRLISTFCNGLLSYADEATSAKIMDEVLKICGGSTETVSDILQTKFFADHTPFYWVIANRHGRSAEVPPLLSLLLATCDSLTVETQGDVVNALYREYDSEVYRAVMPKLKDVRTHNPCSESFFQDAQDRPTVIASSHGTTPTINFKIPRFLDRILVDGEVSLEFLALDRVWSLKAHKDGPDPAKQTGTQWILILSETHCRSNWLLSQKVWSRQLVLLEIHGQNGKIHHQGYQTPKPTGVSYGGYGTYKIQQDGKMTTTMAITDTDLSQFYCNPYTSERRQLHGTISIKPM